MIVDIIFNFKSDLEVTKFTNIFIGKQEQRLCDALMSYLKNFCPKEEFKLSNLISLLDLAIDEEQECYDDSRLSILIEDAERHNPFNPTVLKYEKVKAIPYSEFKKVVFRTKKELLAYSTCLKYINAGVLSPIHQYRI